MDRKQLTYFLAIIEEGSITKAAERLNIAQPPLSQMLRQLEEELGVKLVERNTRSLTITEAGKVLQHKAKQILELFENTTRELKDYKEGLQGTLYIGTIAAAADTVLQERLYKYHKAFPGINFQIRERNTDEIQEMLVSGVIEIGIIRTPLNSDLYESILLPEEPMVAATSGEVPWEVDQTDISLEELAGKPLLVHNRYESMIVEACRRKGFEPRILGKIDDTRPMLMWADMGMGIAIVQKDWISLTASTTLKYKEINEPGFKTRLAILWMKDRYLSVAARHFIDTFRSSEGFKY